MYTRDKTNKVKVGNIYIGNNSPISIQSMTNTKTKDIEATINQINELNDAGADIVRLAILDLEDAKAIKNIKKNIKCPIVADIHFNPEYALIAIEQGVDKIRLNPGNISDKDKIKAALPYQTSQPYTEIPDSILDTCSGTAEIVPGRSSHLLISQF